MDASMIEKLHRPIKFLNLNCRRLGMIQRGEKKDKRKRIWRREGVKMKTEEHGSSVPADFNREIPSYFCRAKNVWYLLCFYAR